MNMMRNKPLFFSLAWLTVQLLVGWFLLGAATAHGTPSPPDTSVAYAQPRDSFFRLVCFVDKTGSALQTRTEQVAVADFNPILDLLRQQGGEIAVGLIRDTSNRSLLRLRIAPPPAEPSLLPETGNAFLVAQNRAANQSTRKAYEVRFVQWQTSADQDIEAFQDVLKGLLEAEADAPASDIAGAVQRADLFLAEPSEPNTRRYALFVTDGLDNMTDELEPMRSTPQILIANGAASAGLLETLNPVKFESVQAAFRYLVSQAS